MDNTSERWLPMRVILFGATGMVGQGVLRECLRDSAVAEIVCVGRTPVSVQDPKVKELVTANLFELDRIEAACPSRTIATLPTT
jgi:saccharopine dehydrogenase-like NADP-dependent oxidoreductase